MDEDQVNIQLKEKEEPSHNVPKLVVVVVNAVVFIILFIWNNYTMYSRESIRQQLGLENKTVNLTEADIDIPPAPVVYIMWLFMYVWNLSWIIYTIAILFKKTSIGYLYSSPDGGVIPVTTYLLFIVGLICLRLHVEPWTRHGIILSTIFLFLSGFFMIGALTFSGWRSYHIQEALEDVFLDKHLWAVRLLCQNGLGIITTWAITSAVLFDANKIIITYSSLSPYDSSSICIGILAFLFLVFAGCALIPYGKYNVHTISPYCVFLYILSCVIYRNWEYGNRNAIMIAVLICFTAAALLLKLGRIALGLLKYCFEDRYVKRYWDSKNKK